MEQNFVEKLIRQDYMDNLRRFAVGVGLAASMPLGPVAFVGTGLAATSITAVQRHFERRRKEKKLVELCKEEIGALTGKPAEALTLSDLHRAAGKSTALRKQTEEYAFEQNTRIGISAVSSAITMGLMVALSHTVSGFLAEFPTILQLGLVGFGFIAVRSTVETLADAVLQRPAYGNACEKLMALESQARSKPVHPTQVLDVFMEASPDLREGVQRRFGQAYERLTILQKMQAVQEVEPELRVIGLTEALNRGEIRPGLVAMLAYGEATDAMQGFAQYKALFRQPPRRMEETDERIGLSAAPDLKHVRRLLDERDAMPVFLRTLN